MNPHSGVTLQINLAPTDLPHAKHILPQSTIQIDLLGSDPGMWSVHPPYRSKLFYDRLPTLIQQIETGDVPEAQRGCHDMNDNMVDWSSSRKPLWKRAMKRMKIVVDRFWPHQEAGDLIGAS